MAFGDERRLVPQMLDDLEVDDNVDRLVREREIHQVAPEDRHFRIAPARVLDGRRVVVDAGDDCPRGGEHCAAITFAGAGLEYLLPAA